jgi:hypothetical protein
MSYVLDVKQDFIKHAMDSLGIELQELEVKRLEDYQQKDTLPDVQRLRFNFFRRKQRELVKKINKSEHNLSRFSDLEEKSQEQFDKSPSSFFKLKKKHQELLDKHLERVKNKLFGFRNLQGKLKNVEKAREELRNSVTNRKRLKLQEIENKIKENKKGRSVSTLKPQTRYLNDFSPPSQDPPSPMKPISLESRSKRLISRSSDSEKEITVKMQKLEEKMDKSKDLKSIQTNLKKLAAFKQNQKVFKSSEKLQNDFSDDYSEKILKLLEKSSELTRRKLKIQKIQTESRLRQRQLEESKRSKTKARLDQYQEDRFKKHEKIIAKEKISSEKINQNRLQKDFLLKNELNRLREEEIHQNARRQKKAL